MMLGYLENKINELIITSEKEWKYVKSYLKICKK